MSGVGSISVSLETDRLVVCTSRGHLTIEMSRRAQAEIDRLFAAHPQIDCILYDATALEGFDPGLPIRWIKWAISRPRKSRRVALVGSLGSGRAVAATFRYLLPALRYGVFSDRAAAIAYLQSANDSVFARG